MRDKIRNAAKKAWAAGYRAKWRAAVIAVLGGKCIRCGFADARALQIDHVYGGGNKEYGKPSQRTVWQTTYYKKVVKNAESGKYQLLCANCNWIKKFENKEI